MITSPEPSESASDTTALVAEDLLLLLFDPASGSIRGEGTTLFNVLAGAVLVDLTFEEHVDLKNEGWTRGKEVAAKGAGPTDPILRKAWDRIARRPLEVHTVVHAIGPYLREPILERLIHHGHLRRERRRIFGLIPTTALVDGGTDRREKLLDRVRRLLTDGVEPDHRTAALAALLSASDTLPRFHPEIPWSGAVYTNGKKLQRGQWGSAAAAAVIARTAASLITASFVTNIAINLADD